MRNILILTVSVSLLLCGCSEKPERKAAKEVRKSAANARKVISDSRTAAQRIMREGDPVNGTSSENIKNAAAKSQKNFNEAQKLIRESFERAQSEMEISLRKNSRQAGQFATPAIITSGNILFSQALHQQSRLASLATPIDSLIDDISKKVMAIGDFSTVKSLREKLIEANKKEIKQLGDVLGKGTDSYLGLKEQLSVEEKKLVAIDRKLQSLESVAKDSETAANKIEKSAASKLRAAEALAGDEKLALQNEAYDLQLSKQEFSMKLQTANDEIEILESQASIITPIANKLVKDINAIEKMIDDLGNAKGNDKLLEDIQLIENKSNEYAKSILQYIADIDQALMRYLSSVGAVTDLLDKAKEQYSNVKGSSGRDMAKSRLADCLLWKAGVYAESMRLQKNLAFRVKSVATAADSSISERLSSLNDKVLNAAGEYGTKALDCYDLAITEYENISGSGEFDCSIRKTIILALYGKMAFAEFLGDTALSDAESDKAYKIADAATEKAEKLIEETKACDPMFAMSITVRMIGGEIDYTPKLRVDLAGYYEDIRKDFQSWNKLKGVDKEAEVNRLLGVLQNMMPAEDPEAFNKVLGPEMEQLKAAKKKGFDEDDLDFDSSGSDPNY